MISSFGLDLELLSSVYNFSYSTTHFGEPSSEQTYKTGEIARESIIVSCGYHFTDSEDRIRRTLHAKKALNPFFATSRTRPNKRCSVSCLPGKPLSVTAATPGG